VAGDEQGGVGALGGEPADAALPELDPLAGRQGDEVVGAGPLRVPARGGVGLAPAVVVLAGGEEDVVPPGVVRQPVRAPEGEDLPRQVGVAGLGDEEEGGVLGDDDHAWSLPR